MELKDFNLSVNQNVKDVTFNGNILHVKQYLPLKDKFEIASGVSYGCLEEGGKIINHFKRDMILSFLVLKYYSDIEGKLDGDVNELYNQYDMIKTSGLLDTILNEIPNIEWDELNNYINKFLSETQKYNLSLVPYAETIAQLITYIGQLPVPSVEPEMEQTTNSTTEDSKEETVEDNSNNENEKFEVIK